MRAVSFESDDYEQAVETFFDKGWSDGLPVVLPTRKLVEAMIAAGGRDRDENLGPIGPKNNDATVEMLAINAVMGGCKPEYFPIVLAAMEAMLAPEHNLTGVIQTTHMCCPLVIVGGPIAKELKFNSREGIFGNGYRANATVGRAVRLAIWNIGGAVPWETDMSTMSHPGEYTFCIAEEEEENPWPPLHVERGCAPGSNAVTVFACEPPHSVDAQGTPAEMLYSIGDSLIGLGNNNAHYAGQTLVVINRRQAAEFAKAGWSKDDIRHHLWDNARRPGGELKACGVFHEGMRKALVEQKRTLARYDYTKLDDASRIPVTDRPEDIHIVVAGGVAYFAAVLPGWGAFGGYAVTRPVRIPGR
ncbi:hypothetical protein [Ramlibacter sp.]|uniref:hypothetical protein n=1 Tax=Ramlibacter sp. TaxID=1917967 RepID=UPI003D12B075